MELSEIIKEIHLVPENKLPEIYDFIHSLRSDLEIVQDNATGIMAFAGCWQDMKNEEFEGFSREIAARRKQAFLGRIGRETVTD